MPVMEVIAPERSRAQRLEALDLANAIRSYRAELKVRLRRRQVSPLAVIMAEDEQLASMKLIDVLLVTPKVGRVKAHKILMAAKVAPSKTVGGLSERQRRDLAALLPRFNVT